MQRITLLPFVCVALLASSQCATFLTLDKKENSEQEFKASGKKTLAIQYSQFQQIEKETQKAPENDRLITQKRIAKLLNATNQFSDIRIIANDTTPAGTDLTIKFTATSTVNNKTSALKILAIITLGVVPMQFEQETKLTAEIFDKNGKKIKVTEGSFGSSTWIGWFILPVMPFFYPDSQADKAFDSMLKAALVELKKDNIL